MFLNYSEFINESKDERISLAKSLASQKHLAEVLNNCEEGKHKSVQINITPGASSYVGVALNDGETFSEVYPVSDPKVALVALVMKNTGRKDPKEISNILTVDDEILNYAVFAGDRAMTHKEVIDKYNFGYKIPAGDAVPIYTSTPVTVII
jgi:hypothetical protein